MDLRYLNWLQADEELKIREGNNVQIYELQYNDDDDEILNEWAKHFRENYCSDEEIEDMIDGTGLSRPQYLLKNKFPDEKRTPGPSIRSGDFSELLIADYIEFRMGYYVPRTRYDRKTIKDESTKGSDLLAFKVVHKDFSDEDILLVDEVKGSLSSNGKKERLQDAVNDSMKDLQRLGESLNAAKQRLRDKGEREKMKIVRRFQAMADRPFVLRYGASAVINNSLYDKEVISETSISEHLDKDIILIVVRGNELMKLANELYRRASLC